MFCRKFCPRCEPVWGISTAGDVTASQAPQYNQVIRSICEHELEQGIHSLVMNMIWLVDHATL